MPNNNNIVNLLYIMRVTDKFVFFWGSELSNFYKCNFELDNHKWVSSEQYFMYRKAIYFNDIEIAELIMKSKNPKHAKELGRQVKNFDESKWSAVSEQIMEEAVFAKFSQNEYLRNYLLSDYFKNKHFVEASPLDKIWGIGLHYDDLKCDNPDNWLGQNKLGIVLDRVRERLKK